MREVKQPDGRVVRYKVVDFDVLGMLSASSTPDGSADATNETQRDPVDPAARDSGAQRHEEAELVAQVVAEAHRVGRFQGRAWEQLSHRLWTYAWKTLQAKIGSGEIASMVDRYDDWRRLHVDPADAEVLRLSADARSELANDTILRAIPDFQRNALMMGRWSAEGGASLTTYFLGTCALHFRRAYQQWSLDRRGRLDRLASHYGLDLHDIGQQVALAVSDVASDDPRVEVALTLLNQADQTTRLIYGMKMREMTYAEIGGELGLSASAVETRVRRFNRVVKSWTGDLRVIS